MGSYILASRSFISGLLCHEALSRRMVESSCQPGVSKSSCRTKYLRKVVMTSESVLAYVRATHILPSVSKAAISEILGATYLSV